MSSHKIQYRIYADDDDCYHHDRWAKADRYINGMAYSHDKNEAFAIAKKAAKNCRHPFIVMVVALPNCGELCDAYIIN